MGHHEEVEHGKPRQDGVEPAPHVVSHRVVAAQVETESKLGKRMKKKKLLTLKPTRSRRGQPGHKLESSWGQDAVKLGTIWVELGSSWDKAGVNLW